MLEDVRCPTSASSHHLAEALSSMPNLTDLILNGEEFQEEFYSSLNAKASTLQVCMCVCSLYPCNDEYMYTCKNGDSSRIHVLWVHSYHIGLIHVYLIPQKIKKTSVHMPIYLEINPFLALETIATGIPVIVNATYTNS